MVVKPALPRNCAEKNIFSFSFTTRTFLLLFTHVFFLPFLFIFFLLSFLLSLPTLPPPQSAKTLNCHWHSVWWRKRWCFFFSSDVWKPDRLIWCNIHSWRRTAAFPQIHQLWGRGSAVERVSTRCESSVSWSKMCCKYRWFPEIEKSVCVWRSEWVFSILYYGALAVQPEVRPSWLAAPCLYLITLHGYISYYHNWTNKWEIPQCLLTIGNQIMYILLPPRWLYFACSCALLCIVCLFVSTFHSIQLFVCWNPPLHERMDNKATHSHSYPQLIYNCQLSL